MREYRSEKELMSALMGGGSPSLDSVVVGKGRGLEALCASIHVPLPITIFLGSFSTFHWTAKR